MQAQRSYKLTMQRSNLQFFSFLLTLLATPDIRLHLWCCEMLATNRVSFNIF